MWNFHSLNGAPSFFFLICLGRLKMKTMMMMMGGFREKSHNHTLQEARKSKKRNKEKDLVWQLTIQPIRWVTVNKKKKQRRTNNKNDKFISPTTSSGSHSESHRSQWHKIIACNALNIYHKAGAAAAVPIKISHILHRRSTWNVQEKDSY